MKTNIILLLTLFVSCTSHQNKKITYHPTIDDNIIICYNDSILILSTKGSIYSDTLFIRNGNVYDSEDRLFFTTEKDTVLYYKENDNYIKTTLMKKKGKEDEYEAKTFISRGGLPERLTISYTYDSSYRIIKIQRVVLADYVLN